MQTRRYVQTGKAAQRVLRRLSFQDLVFLGFLVRSRFLLCRRFLAV